MDYRNKSEQGVAPEQELKPCPFCGGNDVKVELEEPDNPSGFWWVHCPHCSAAIDVLYRKEEAIERWNTRSTPPASGDRDAAAAVYETTLKLAAEIANEWATSADCHSHDDNPCCHIRTGAAVRDRILALVGTPPLPSPEKEKP